MNRPEENDPLDALLREENSYVEDNGFSARVLSALPKSRRSSAPRKVFLLTVSFIGYALAIAWLPWQSMLKSLQNFSLSFQVFSNYAVFLCVFAALICCAFSAFEREEF
jgi:hypothetical protein